MKNIKRRKGAEDKNTQCVLCQANFEIWLDNLKLDPEKKDALHQNLLSYCPACTKKDGCN